MKKTLALLLALVMVVALCACGQSAPAASTTTSTGENTTAAATEEGGIDALEPVPSFLRPPMPTLTSKANMPRSGSRPSKKPPTAKSSSITQTPALSATTRSCSKAPSTASMI